MNYLFSFLNLHHIMEDFSYGNRRYINVINVNNGHPRHGKGAIMQMRQEMEQYKDQFHKVSRELKIQENKNADLRSKNWKAMEALNNVERLYQKVLKSESSQPGGYKKQYTPAMDRMDRYRKELRIQTEAEEVQKSYLLSLFGDFLDKNDIPLNVRSHKEWLDIFANTVNEWKTDYKKLKSSFQDQNDLHNNRIKSIKLQMKKHKEESEKYQTELHKLQSTMGARDHQWKAQMKEKENELEDIRLKVVTTVENTQKNVKELEEKLKKEKMEQNQMEHKILRLHGKLSNEESKRKKVSKKLYNLKQQNDMERNSLLSEIASLRTCLDTEKLHRQYLEDRILQMDQTIFIGQKTLKEKDDTIDNMKKQLKDFEQVALLRDQTSYDTKETQTEIPEIVKERNNIDIKDLSSYSSKIPSYKNKNKKKKKKKQKHVF